MKRTVAVLLQGGYWLIYLLLLSVIFAIVETPIRKTPPNFRSLFPLIILCVAPNLISFYSFYYLLFSKFLSRKKIFALILFGTMVCLISALSGIFISLI